ncbi:MAG: acylphosphatase [Acidobacteriota bacterium]
MSGVVQGVGFRYFTYEAARALGLRGFVRNLPDGTVEAWTEGNIEAIEQMRARLERGPASSKVTGVSAEPVEPTGSYTHFKITR